jgi:NADH:ubiquinone oxidoreductase subunit 3 (subunit A)
MGPCFEIAESSSPLRVLFQYFTFVCLFVCFTSDTYLATQAAYYVRYFHQIVVCSYILFLACCMSCLTYPSGFDP